jgi:hypothetical protein
MLNMVDVCEEERSFLAIEQEEGFPPVPSVERYPVASVEIKHLVLEGSPRLAGEDPVHIRALAEIQEHLPPIIVHGPTMHVIDGMHRIRAALLNGRETIAARMVDCDSETAFVLAVKANVTHGLPLSPADRKVAAVSIIASHPHWSDRAVAVATGLSDKTVSTLRAGSTAEAPQSNDRMGRDGRVRPLTSAARREQAAAMIHDRPEAGLREIARATGLSPATVRDVRIRTYRGEDPVPARYRKIEGDGAAAGAQETACVPVALVGQPQVWVDRATLLAKLVGDPTLRFTETGRLALRWLHLHSIDYKSCQGVEHRIPDHWAAPVAELARSCAMAWLMLADQLEKRA